MVKAASDPLGLLLVEKSNAQAVVPLELFRDTWTDGTAVRQSSSNSALSVATISTTTQIGHNNEYPLRLDLLNKY